MIYWLIEAEKKDKDLTKINYETNMKSQMVNGLYIQFSQRKTMNLQITLKPINSIASTYFTITIITGKKNSPSFSNFTLERGIFDIS